MTEASPPRWVPPDLQRMLEAHPRYNRMVEEAYWAGVRAGRPYVSVGPAMRSGQPCVNNTRLRVEDAAGMAWVEGVDVAADEYDVTRGDVLVACWFAGTYGLPGRSLALTRTWRDRWGAWAREVHGALWETSSVDYGEVPDPPARDES